VSVRPRAKEQDRCPHCRRRCAGYDQGEGRRRWRALDLATTFCFPEADAPRVNCRRHGVVVAAVPWARHDAGFTRSFEDQTAWLTVNTSKTAVSELMRIAWRTVGWICERVAAEAQAKLDLRAGLKRLGIDEISVRKGQRYLTVVIDRDTGRLVWAHPGRDKQTAYKFLDLLGKDRCQQVQLRPALRPARNPDRPGARRIVLQPPEGRLATPGRDPRPGRARHRARPDPTRVQHRQAARLDRLRHPR
jgi:transposase